MRSHLCLCVRVGVWRHFLCVCLFTIMCDLSVCLCKRACQFVMPVFACTRACAETARWQQLKGASRSWGHLPDSEAGTATKKDVGKWRNLRSKQDCQIVTRQICYIDIVSKWLTTRRLVSVLNKLICYTQIWVICCRQNCQWNWKDRRWGNLGILL